MVLSTRWPAAPFPLAARGLTAVLARATAAGAVVDASPQVIARVENACGDGDADIQSVHVSLTTVARPESRQQIWPHLSSLTNRGQNR